MPIGRLPMPPAVSGRPPCTATSISTPSSRAGDEHRAPAREVGEQAAQRRRNHRCCDHGHGDVGQQRSPSGRGCRGRARSRGVSTSPAQPPAAWTIRPDDQHRDGGRHRAHDAAGEVDDEAADQGRPPPETIRDRAVEQHGDGDGERRQAEHELRARRADPEAGLDRRAGPAGTPASRTVRSPSPEPAPRRGGRAEPVRPSSRYPTFQRPLRLMGSACAPLTRSRPCASPAR